MTDIRLKDVIKLRSSAFCSFLFNEPKGFSPNKTSKIEINVARNISIRSVESHKFDMVPVFYRQTDVPSKDTSNKVQERRERIEEKLTIVEQVQ